MDITPCEKEYVFENKGTFETIGTTKFPTPFRAKILSIVVVEWSGNFLCSQFGVNALRKVKCEEREHYDEHSDEEWDWWSLLTITYV